MHCHHFEAGRCRSCTWLEQSYPDQLTRKQQHCAETLSGFPALEWLDPASGLESGFRNKAKMVASGTAEAPVLGIIGPEGGVDLQDCGLHVPVVAAALPVLAEFVTRARLDPYDIAGRQGELKYVLVTGSPGEQLMVRFVVRSQEPVARLRKHLPWLLAQLPGLVVVSVNLQPEHKAIIEGDREIVLTEESELVMDINGIGLGLRPQSFFQTNTTVAAALYQQCQAWAAESPADVVWDLYCGVGGFALHLAGSAQRVVGIELSAEAVNSARVSARRRGSDAEFVAADVATWVAGNSGCPDLVVLNPPRRGIGPELASWLESSSVDRVLYSSCNPVSLAEDLAAMPSLEPIRGRLFDMFPHTAHAEVLVLLQRAPRRG